MNRFSQKARVSKGFSTCSENNTENIFNYLQDVTQPIAKSEMSWRAAYNILTNLTIGTSKVHFFVSIL